MRKYIGLSASIIMITLSAYTLYHMNQPRTGPVADGEISSIYTFTYISFLIGGLLFLAYNLKQFFHEK